VRPDRIAPVVPTHLIDDTRRSREVEARTMGRIRERVAARDADAGARLAPTGFVRTAEVHRDDAISNAFRRPAHEYRIGSQSGWLARFRSQHRPDDTVLSYEAGRFGSQRVLRGAMVEAGWQIPPHRRAVGLLQRAAVDPPRASRGR
jgi:hypothetical protein